MTNPQTTTNHYFRVMVALATLAMIAAMLLAPGPSYASTTFTVNLSDDRADANPGDGTCSVVSFGAFCSLRAAIQEANATPGADVIHFDVGTGTDGLVTISPDSALPAITQPVVVDGYTQAGAQKNTLSVGDNAVIKVELDGSSAAGTTTSPANGLEIRDSSGSVIRGLAINKFSGNGILVAGDTSSGATIASDNLIEGNFIGTDASGKQDLGNASAGVGVLSGAFGTTIGGASSGQRNIISGNNSSGVFMLGGSASSQVSGNYIGTDRSGKLDLGNGDFGVVNNGANNNTIGGATAGSRNLVSGNGRSGIVVIDSRGNRVLGNRVGTTASGSGPLANSGAGIHLFFASGTSVGDGTSAGSNTVAFNLDEGIRITGNTESVGNALSRNSIFSNGGLGIDFVAPGEDDTTDVPTANDAGDTDTGPNNLQNKPVITSAKTSSTATTITGKLNSDNNPGNVPYVVQFFSNPSGGDEGKKFIGQKTVTTDASGNATFTFKPGAKVGMGRTITATATRDLSGVPSDTSEFSAPKMVASA
jgi:CSLREA domain-containing protein